MSEKYAINIGRYTYPFCVSENIRETIDLINEIETDYILFVYDDKLDCKLVDYIYSRIVNSEKKGSKLAIESYENKKNMKLLNEVFKHAFKEQVTTNSTIIAIGGGVLGNLVGLVAGLIYRGIKLIHIPTTVIAATDSTISLKQAINWDNKKNSVGIYYKPMKVIIEFDFFKTLSKFDYICGLVEMVKNILCITPHLKEKFNELFDNGVKFTKEELMSIIEMSIEAKQKVLKSDEKERNDGIALEYGHTVGHALEMLSGGRLNHGLGVAIGMLISAEISKELGKINDNIVTLHWELLNRIGIIDYIKKNNLPSSTEIVGQMKLDNKRGRINCSKEEIPMVVLESLGKCCKTGNVKLLAVNESILIKAIEEYNKKIS